MCAMNHNIEVLLMFCYIYPFVNHRNELSSSLEVYLLPDLHAIVGG